MRTAVLMAATGIVFGVILGRVTAPTPAAAEGPVGNGDVNGDAAIDIGDAVCLLNWLFLGGPAPEPIECAPGDRGSLPATGQTECSGYEADRVWIVVPCASAQLSGQDGAYAAGCPNAGRFVDHGDGTVTDECTGLMWQEDTADTSGDGSIGGLPANDDSVLWEEALAYCEGLSLASHDDWRLPNVRELLSLIDYGRVGPAIDPSFGAVPFFYWSSTPGANDPDNVWFVDFGGGSAYSSDDRGDRFYVRAVRGGR